MKICLSRLALAALFAAALLIPTPLGTTAHAQAGATTTNQTLPYNAVVNDCDGNPVTLTGRIHVVTHYTFSSSGGTNFTMHTNYEEVQGSSTQTATLYRGVSSNMHKITDNGPTAQSTFTTVDRVRLISLGPSSNLIFNVTIHTTVNSNGEATSTVANTTVECVG